MTVSMRARPYATFLEVYGTKGTLRADLVRETCTVHRERPMPRMLSKVVYNLEEVLGLAAGTALSSVNVLTGRMPNMPGLHVLVRDLYEAIRRGTPPPVPGEEGLRTVELMERIWAGLPEARDDNVTPPVVVGKPATEAERRVTESGLGGRALVTGAAGFLGSRVATALLRCGVPVVAVVRDRGGVSRVIEQHAEVVTADIRDPDAMEALLEDVAVVFHCAAITTNHARWALHYETNVRGTQSVLRAARAAGVKRAVHMSSVAVYGMDPPPSGNAIAESVPYAQPGPWDHYIRSKAEADHWALEYAEQSGLAVTVLRAGVLYGPGAPRSVAKELVRVGPLSLTLGAGRNRHPYTFVENAVDAMLLAALSEHERGQAFNVVDDPQLSVRDVVAAKSAINGDRPFAVPVPSPLLRSAAAVLQWRAARAGTDRPPRLSDYVVRAATTDICYDTTKVREQLGWRPEVSLDEGLRRTFDGSE
jgi:nucleoside-diphosphate-sugar epimerase